MSERPTDPPPGGCVDDSIPRLDYATKHARRDLLHSDAKFIRRFIGLMIGTILVVTAAATLWVLYLLLQSPRAAVVTGS